MLPRLLVQLPSPRAADLTSESTRYDELVAAPSDETLQKMWLGNFLIVVLVVAFMSTVFLSLVTHRVNRKQPFNAYLIYLMIPDFSFSILCGVTCLINFVHGSYHSLWMCQIQSVYMVFGIGGNAWMNAVISWQLYRMISSAQAMRRYIPPSLRTIARQAIAVYAYTIGLGLLAVSEIFPFQTQLMSGIGCMPGEYDKTSTIFFYTAFIPLLIVIPMSYVMYVCYQTWRHNLLPPPGKRRELVFYYARIVTVFIIMWLPVTLCMLILRPWLSDWGIWFAGAWSHFQGAASAAVSLLKTDLWQGYREFLQKYQCSCLTAKPPQPTPPIPADASAKDPRDAAVDASLAFENVSPADETSRVLDDKDDDDEIDFVA